jgi:hypothetical protein
MWSKGWSPGNVCPSQSTRHPSPAQVIGVNVPEMAMARRSPNPALLIDLPVPMVPPRLHRMRGLVAEKDMARPANPMLAITPTRPGPQRAKANRALVDRAQKPLGIEVSKICLISDSML